MRDLQTEWMEAMRRGDYPAAWTVNDAVLATRDPGSRDDPDQPYHLRWVWDGRSWRDKHVLVRCYHGLGDTLQFARYLPVLRAQVRSLTVEVQPALLPLLSLVPGLERLVPFDVAHPLPPSDCDVEIMELPHLLRLPPEAIPMLDLTLAATRSGQTGLCWRSGGWDTARDVPETLAIRLSENAVSLQPDSRLLGPCPSRIEDTARLIAGLDRVITVDTMVAHLAGTLRCPTCLLLKHQADWRWQEGRADSPWYPSIQIFRQPSPGDWDSVVAQVSAMR